MLTSEMEEESSLLTLQRVRKIIRGLTWWLKFIVPGTWESKKKEFQLDLTLSHIVSSRIALAKQ